MISDECTVREYCGHATADHVVSTPQPGFVLHACNRCPCRWREKVEIPQTAPLFDTTPTFEQRVAQRDAERHAIVETLAESPDNAERLRRCRAIAREIADRQGTVTVAEVHDEFVRRYGEHSWRDANGRTYWAGAIFRGEEWEVAGWTKSPHNRNDSNRVWRRRWSAAS